MLVVITQRVTAIIFVLGQPINMAAFRAQSYFLVAMVTYTLDYHH